jgi:hypothetical protein
LIQKNLAQVYENLGIFDLANALLDKAIQAYTQLRDRNTVKALRKEKQRLKNEKVGYGTSR